MAALDTLSVTLRNDGQTRLSTFERMDLIVVYETGSGEVRKWLPFEPGALSANAWTVDSIDDDAFEPGMVNPGETAASDGRAGGARCRRHDATASSSSAKPAPSQAHRSPARSQDGRATCGAGPKTCDDRQPGDRQEDRWWPAAPLFDPCRRPVRRRQERARAAVHLGHAPERHAHRRLHDREHDAQPSAPDAVALPGHRGLLPARPHQRLPGAEHLLGRKVQPAVQAAPQAHRQHAGLRPRRRRLADGLRHPRVRAATRSTSSRAPRSCATRAAA